VASCPADHADVTAPGGDPVALTVTERLAALEAAVRPRAEITAPGDWSPEQVEEFRRHFDSGAWRNEPIRLLPPTSLLTPDTARALLSECVTIVKPGETLVIRVDPGWTPQQAEYYQEYVDVFTAHLEDPFRVLVVIGEELAVVRPEEGE
jgi:hypothetical protein